MATLSDALTFARYQAQTDSNGLSDTVGIVFANEALLDFHRRLITNGVDASQLQEAYRDATAGVGTYLYPTNPQLFFLKAIELNYGDTTLQNYIRAEQIDIANPPGNVSFSWLRVNASPSQPYWDDHGDWYEIFPTPITGNNLSQTIRLIYYLKPTEFSATSDTISYPSSLDYRILALRIAANYKRSLQDFNSAAAFDIEYENKVKDLIGTLARGSQQPLQPKPLQITGFEY